MRFVIESLAELHPNIAIQDFLYLVLSNWLCPNKYGRFKVITENCCMLKWEEDDVLIIYGRSPKLLHVAGSLVNDIVCQLNTNSKQNIEDILIEGAGTIDYIIDLLPWPKINDQMNLQ
jgi:hypothetical protein